MGTSFNQFNFFSQTRPWIYEEVQNVWTWEHSISGVYSVKDAHRWLMHSDGSHVNGVNWRWIWRLKIPTNIQFFLWQLCHESIPTKSVLKGRGIGIDDSCPLCEVEVEAIIHSLFTCARAKEYPTLVSILIYPQPSFFDPPPPPCSAAILTPPLSLLLPRPLTRFLLLPPPRSLLRHARCSAALTDLSYALIRRASCSVTLPPCSPAAAAPAEIVLVRDFSTELFISLSFGADYGRGCHCSDPRARQQNLVHGSSLQLLSDGNR